MCVTDLEREAIMKNPQMKQKVMEGQHAEGEVHRTLILLGSSSVHREMRPSFCSLIKRKTLILIPR